MRGIRLLVAVLALVALVAMLALLRPSSEDEPAEVGTGPGAVAERAGVRVGTIRIQSDAAGRALEIALARPLAPAPDRGLLVFLHGQGGSPGEFTTNAALLEALGDLGADAPAIAFPEGGERGYWHDREEAEWERWVVAEAIPAATRRLRTGPGRVAIGGISMGGFGAYSIALSRPRRFCATGGHSAAIWPEFGEAFAGAFDGAEDFARHDLLARAAAGADPFRGRPVWNDHGDDDWFVTGNRRFVGLLRGGGTNLAARIWPGGHDAEYWDSHWDEYLGFYARALAGCEVANRVS